MAIEANRRDSIVIDLFLPDQEEEPSPGDVDPQLPPNHRRNSVVDPSEPSPPPTLPTRKPPPSSLPAKPPPKPFSPPNPSERPFKQNEEIIVCKDRIHAARKIVEEEEDGQRR
ncbi:hypothetical protein K505DRAFT_368688 [Melanomma pulvis-pyrius CBS 109.77]|uniref:Uncharacterized protein n=1 Tax=Melanomma pulvis-pyrius CBS 109.77 TaxID=1314802 RepID=A0A6A6WPP9_9PLEO|nr:hypothetical protein K505DRAFT_368688 [Melanomma pulvis-pyrius CBS 109.77]